MDLIILEDEHLLAVNKPAGWNTHSPSPFAGEGLYEWLRQREPRWRNLSILHRLDKETSGLIVFGKTPTANRALTQQFEEGRVCKIYLFLTASKPPAREITARSALVRVGPKYVCRPPHAGATVAETRFQPLGAMIEARPLTGKTHQIRAQAAAEGFPILGDTLYGGAPGARLCLHAAQLQFAHPASGQTISLSAPPDFARDPRLALRRAIIDPAATNAFRVVHGASDDCPGLYLDQLSDCLLAQTDGPLSGPQRSQIEDWAARLGAKTVFHKILQREAKGSPAFLLGAPSAGEVSILENGVRFELHLDEGYSAGLFLDQRDNRRRFLTRYIAPDLEIPAGAEVLNTFAYTCGFSLCAALGGARATSLDLSKNYLEWGRRNFLLNSLDPAAHDFIFGDVFDWLRRMVKKGRTFDVIILDPPTFSRSKESGTFRAEQDYGTLVASALPALKPGGLLLASTNASELAPEDFVQTVTSAITRSGRPVLQRHYIPQPPDFPVSHPEPAYLKTLWVRAG
jgi:23S rRNA (cytosine1962-C5)-methyltransferase